MWVYVINFLLAILGTGFLRSQVEALQHSGLLCIGSFLLVFTLLWLISFIYNRHYFYQMIRILHLFLFFLKELLVATLRVSYEVLTPKNSLNPAVISVPLEVSSDLEIMLLANMITLTPGTLSLDVSQDKKHLYVHTLYSEGSLVAFRENIKQGFEKKILAISKA